MNLDAIRENFQRHGALAGVHDLTKKAVNRFVPTRVLRVMKLTPASVQRSFLSLPSGYDAGFEDAAALRKAAQANAELGLDDAFVDATLGRGDRCYGIRHHGELVSYGWYSTLATPMNDDLTFRCHPTWVYMYKAFTLPRCRGRRLHGIGVAHALDRVTASPEAKNGLIAYVESNNFASLKSHARVGYQDIGTIMIVTIAGTPKIFAAPTCSDYGVAVELRSWMQ